MEKDKSIELFRAQAKPPQEALKPIIGGNLKGLSDINPQWRIEALTETYGLYGVGWFVQVKETTTVDVPDTHEKMLFLTLELYVRDWSLPDEYKWFGPAIGIGGDFLIIKDKNGIHGNDEAYAMAMTDALGKAAKLIGVANDIYRGKFDSKYGWRDEKQKREAIKEENYRITNEGICIKCQNGFVNINTLSKEQLEVIVKFKKFADIKEYIEKRIAEL
jgi:hypothetical protein